MVKKYGKTIVASVVVLVLIVVVTIIGSYVRAEPVSTHHSSWRVIRASAAEDAADFATALPLATSEGDFANKPSGAYHITSRDAIGSHSEGYSPGGAWMFAICGVGVDTDTFSFNIVGWGKTNGMAQVIAEGDGALGPQDVVIYPGGAAVTDGFWADTITLDETTKWPSVAAFNSGDNEVATIVVDTTGLEWIQFIVYDALGAQASEANSVAVYGRRY